MRHISMIRMKRLLFLLLSFLGILSITFSCGNSDKNYSLIKKEFKKHVHKTFDDPNSLKEVVEIVPSDTFSIEKIKRMIQTSLETCDLAIETAHLEDSLQKTTLDVENIDRKKSRNSDFMTRMKVVNLVSTMMDLLSKNMSAIKDIYECKIPLEMLKDSLLYKAPVYEYEVRYRVKKGDELKLEKQYAYIDSLSGFNKISSDRMTGEEYSEQYGQAIQYLANAMQKIEKLDGITQKRHEIATEMKSIIDMYR